MLALAVAAGRASTLTPLPGSPGYVHEVFTIEDGLPQAGIVRALQARDGFLWIATFDGLARFDGIRFEIFDSGRVPAMGSDRITDLIEGRDGTLWFRSEQGHVVRYSADIFRACGLLPDGGATCDLDRSGSPAFTALHEDGSGVVWLAGPAGLFRFASGVLERMPGSVEGSEVTTILQDRRGVLWVGTPRGLWRGRPGRFEPVAMPAEGSGRIDRLAESDRGEIWVTTPTGAGRVRAGRFEPEIPGGYAVSDGTGGVWLARPGNLVRQRGGRVETWAAGLSGHPFFPPRQVSVSAEGETWVGWAQTLFRDGVPMLHLAKGQITSVSRDGEGTIWVTLSDSGQLHAVHPARVTTLASGLASPVIYPVYEDRDGTLLVGGDNFFARLAPGGDRFQSRQGPVGPLLNVLAFLRDGSGVLLVGTNRGLFAEEDGRYAGPLGPEDLWEAAIHALFEDSSGRLWVGTERGLFRREPAARGGGWTAVTPAAGLTHPFVRVIREEPAGTLWFGTNGGGIFRWSDGRFRSVTKAHGLSSDLVRAIYPAPDGRLWIATENAGINRLDPGSLDRAEGPAIAVISERQGLYTRGVHQMVGDDLGNLWMSSNRGIFRARLADLNAVADGRLTSLVTFAYDERDGMRSREANGGGQDSGLRDRQGRIWFPTQDGVVRIDPRQLPVERPPVVHVVRLKAGEEEVPFAGGEVRLTPRQRTFTFEVTAPTFRAPERQRFRYRLVPYDRAWIDAGTRREAFYTQVPPGSYTFEVQTAGDGGEWSPPARVSLEVVPRFFETAWFLAASGLAALTAIAGVLRWRGARLRRRQHDLERLVEERTETIAEQAEQLRELDRLKSQFFANVSHELRTPLTLILGPLDDAFSGRLGNVGREVLGELDIARRNARRLLGLVDQLLDLSRLDTGRLELKVGRADLALLLSSRVEAFLPLAERRGTLLELVSPDEPVELYFDEVQLEKVFDNLIGNALKFTPEGGRVRVTLTPRDSGAEVTVEDDGPGIPAEALPRVFDRFYQVDATSRRRFSGTGIGLALAKEIVELHRGSISVTSEEGKGTCFTVALKRGGDHFPAEVMAGRIPTGQVVVEEMPAFAELAQASVWAVSEPPEELVEMSPDDERTTVLVIDDHAEMRSYIRRHLSPVYRVLEAGDGLEGLELARRHVPDLVVSDVMMPGLDGNSLFRTMRADPELELVPFVLLTAQASAESRIQGLEEGVDDYLIKPFDPRELKARVDNLIASRKRLSERFEAAPRTLRLPEVEVTPADEVFLTRVQGAIEERLGDPELSVEALARALHCDRSYLLRRLRTLTGEPPSELIRSLRLQRAEQLLRAGAGAVSEIAYAVGFKSVAHFSNTFHGRYGERPSAFAARHRALPADQIPPNQG